MIIDCGNNIIVRLVFSLAVLAGPAASLAAVAPPNLAPNSQWEIFSGEGFDAKENIEGTGAMPPISIRSNTTGSNTVEFRASGSTGELKVGDLVTLAGVGVDSALTLCPMRVTAVTVDESFSVQAPLGLRPGFSRPGMAQPVNIGMRRGSMSTGDAADGWSKTISMMVWREDNRQNLSPAAYYALGVNKDRDGEEYVSTQPDVIRFRGRTITFGAYVYQKVRRGAGTWRAFVQSSGAGGDTVTSPPAAPSSGYQWMEVSYKVPADATALAAGLRFDGAAGDTYYVTDPVLTIGTEIGVDNYIKPQEDFRPIVHISPLDWINANITFPIVKDGNGFYGNMFDAYAETGGAVAPTVRQAFGELEGMDDGAVQTGTTYVRVIAFYDREAAPERSGSFLPQYVAKVKSFNVLDLPLDGTGRAAYVSGVAGDSWYNVSLELDRFILQ